jgi:hypothetical protein
MALLISNAIPFLYSGHYYLTDLDKSAPVPEENNSGLSPDYSFNRCKRNGSDHFFSG